MKHINDRFPNFTGDEGKFFLVRCFACKKDGGKENYLPAVSLGTCSWCGWSEKSDEIMSLFKKDKNGD